MTLQRSIAFVDLKQRTAAAAAIAPGWQQDFLGGRGVAARLLYSRVCEAPGPALNDSVRILSAGLLTGAAAPADGRARLMEFHPGRGLAAELTGGAFGAEMRWAGFDHLFLLGQAAEPLYIWLCDGKIEIRSAEALFQNRDFDGATAIRRQLADDRIQSIEVTDAAGGEPFLAAACRGSLGLEIKFPRPALDYCKTLINTTACSVHLPVEGPAGRDLARVLADCLGTAPKNDVSSQGLTIGADALVQLLRLNTGWKTAPEQLWEAARRICAVERLFCLRAGIADNDAPGVCSGAAVPPAERPAYYQAQEWTDSGVPSERLLRRLGIDSLRFQEV